MGTLRIIAGELKGRRIHVPAGLDVRPTADRVREAMFSVLGGEVVGADVVDAYAGTGALGLEAVSRGAARVVLIEHDPRALTVLRRNVGDLGVGGRCEIRPGRVEDVLRDLASRASFAVVLADPPYGDPSAPGFPALAAGCGVLAPSATLMFQRDTRTSPGPVPEGLERLRTYRYGRTCVDRYRAAGPGPA